MIAIFDQPVVIIHTELPPLIDLAVLYVDIVVFIGIVPVIRQLGFIVLRYHGHRIVRGTILHVIVKLDGHIPFGFVFFLAPSDFDIERYIGGNQIRIVYIDIHA